MILLFISQNNFSQALDKNFVINEKIQNYFSLTRENIHLHINKETYINNESIWFKGYVINKNSGVLNLETTNVYISLIDTEQKILHTKLLLSNFGVFHGNLDLDINLPSGTYYIHAFTNFMNNFEENESSLFKIKILNPKESEVVENKNLLENVTIEITAESGNFIYQCNNRINVSIRDCNESGLKINNINVVDSKNNIINQFSTNSQGYGVFNIFNTDNEQYKIILENSNTRIEEKLPVVQIEGVTLSTSINSSDQHLVEIRTNAQTLKKIQNKKFSLFFQKNQLIKNYDLTIDQEITRVFINNESLFKGINFIKLVDDGNNLLAERIIYNHTNDENNFIIEKTKIENDSLIFKGNIKNRQGLLSISVLPAETISSFESNAITSQLKFNNYLLENLKNYSYYFNNFDRNKQYELDLFLMAQKRCKYEWNNFINVAPKEKYEFQKGINIVVNLNQILPTNNNIKYTGALIIPNENIILQEKINDNKYFIFKNVVVKDSTEVIFSLYSNGENFKSEINSVAQIINNYSKVRIPYTKSCFYSTFKKIEQDNNDFPLNSKITQLKTIELTDKKAQLKYINDTPRNKFAKALKIDPLRDNESLLELIEKNGYLVVNNPGEVKILNRGIPKPDGSLTEPIIIIDDFNLTDLYVLRQYRAADIEEIYFNKYDLSVSSRGGEVGTIRIYPRKESLSKKTISKGLKVNMLTKGFEKEKPFLNPYYSFFNSESFKKYGTIHWIPNVYTDEEGNFEFKSPILEQEKILLNIQGIDTEGNLYYENKIIKVDK